MRTKLAAIAGVLALGIAGCGNQPAVMPDSGGAVNGLQLSGPTSSYPGTSGYGSPYGSTANSYGSAGYGSYAPANPQAQVQSLLSSVAQAYNQDTSIRAQVTVFVQNLQTGESMSGDMDYWFEKPNSTALYVIDSSESNTVGTKLVWMGGDQVAVRTKFIGFWVNTSVSVTDSRILDKRGDSLADTSVGRMMSTLLDPQAQVSMLGSGSYLGQPVVQIAVVSRQSLPGVTSERFTINTQSMLPVIREMYTGNQLTYRIQLKNVQLNAPDPSAFTLTGDT